METPRSPSRWVAPLVLLAALLAVFLVVSGSTDDGGGGGSETTTSEERRDTRRGDRRTSTDRTETGERTTTGPERETYTVRPGDTLGLISERTGVPVETLLELNPDIDPNNLPVGTKIRLRE